MKMLSKLTVIIIILACVLSGCGPGENLNVSDPQDTYGPTESGAPAQSWELSQNHADAAIPGAWLLDEISVPQSGYISSISVKGNLALVVLSDFSEGGGYSDTLSVFDLSRKQLAWNTAPGEELTAVGFLSDGSVCVYHASTASLSVYGQDGQKLYTYEDITVQGNLYADDNEGIWFISDEELYRLYQGNRSSYPLTFSGNAPTIVSVQNGRVLYSFLQSGYRAAFVDIATGEQGWSPELFGFCAGNGLFYKAEENQFSYCLDGERIYHIPISDGAEIIGATAIKHIITIRTTQKTFLLNIETETLTEINEREYYTGMFTGKTDALLLKYMDSTGEHVCCMTDFSAQGDTISIHEATLTEEQLANKEKAEAIAKEYGVYVNWLPTKKGTVVTGLYAAARDQTDNEVSAFLEALEQSLAQLPPDLFRIITRDKVRCIQIESLQDIQSIGEDRTSSPSGFVYALEHSIYLVLNSEQEFLEQMDNGTLVHEIMHILENAIRIDHPETDPFSSWKSMNPEDFVYEEDYVGDWGGWDYVFSYYGSNDNAYFTFQYGQVNAKEDRATVFEAMSYPYRQMFGCPGIKAKADFLADLLMEYYPELYEDTDPIWLNYKK